MTIALKTQQQVNGSFSKPITLSLLTTTKLICMDKTVMELKLTGINTKLFFFLPFLVKEMARTHTSLQLPTASKSVQNNALKLKTYEHLRYFRNVSCVVINHYKDQDKCWATHNTTNVLALKALICFLLVTQ